MSLALKLIDKIDEIQKIETNFDYKPRFVGEEECDHNHIRLIQHLKNRLKRHGLYHEKMQIRPPIGASEHFKVSSPDSSHLGKIREHLAGYGIHPENETPGTLEYHPKQLAKLTEVITV